MRGQGLWFLFEWLGFRVWGLGTTDEGLGIRDWGSGFRVSGIGFRVSVFLVVCLGCTRHKHDWLWVSGYWFLVSGFGFRVYGVGCTSQKRDEGEQDRGLHPLEARELLQEAV